MVDYAAEQAAWNLSQTLIIQIGYLLQRASSKFTSGNLQGCYFDVEEIRTLIHTDLKKHEEEKLDELEKKISELFNKII